MSAGLLLILCWAVIMPLSAAVLLTRGRWQARAAAAWCAAGLVLLVLAVGSGALRP